MKRLIIGFCAAAVLLFAAGCGYRIGTMGHPQLKTIAIAAVKNDTTEYNLGRVLQNTLAEQFMLDGTMKVVSEAKADCILYARIKDSTISEVTVVNSWEKDTDFRPEEWKITIHAEYSVVIPGKKEPLIPLREVSGSANYQAPGDINSARLRGAAQACRETAVGIVEFTTEAW